MAGDWIKMRVWLSRDPRVIRMADYLAMQRPFMNWLTDPVRQSCKESAYEYVTRNVTVALCVTGLLVTWGTAREQGDRFNDDLVLKHCDKYTFDAITDIECFGEAMEAVGWLIENENGSVTFPKFFKDNESPDDKHKRQAAERQARFREKKITENNVSSNEEGNVINNVTVTHREEKRREEENQKQPKLRKRSSAISIQEFFSQCEAKNEKRIPESDPVFDYADQIGITMDMVKVCWQEFVRTHSENGKKQADWRATFRNYVRKNYYKLWYVEADGSVKETPQYRALKKVTEVNHAQH